MIFKILRGIKHFAPNVTSHKEWIFLYGKSWPRHSSINCTVSPFITALISVKDRLVNIFPIAIEDQFGTANIDNSIPELGLQGDSIVLCEILK